MAEEIHNYLRDLLNQIAKERGYNNGVVELQDISSEGASYSSTLHLATISAPPKEDLELFAKVASLGEAMRASDDMITKAFDTERVFYSELSVAFERLYDKHDVAINDRLCISKYYGHGSKSNKETLILENLAASLYDKHDVAINDRLCISKYYGHGSKSNKETLILENLAASGYESFDRFKPFDWDYASAAVSELAKFHALGIAAKEEHLEELESIRKIGLDVFAFGGMTEVLTKQAIKIGKENIKEEYRVKLQNYLKEENILHELAILWKTIDAGFLVHSDYRPSNLMHRKKDGKVQVVPLDFQTLHFGTLTVDLMYFIWSGSDSKFRQQHYEQLLEHFYSELTVALKNLHVEIDEVYPRKTFEKELEDTKTLGLLIGLVMAPILLVEPENAPKIESAESLFLEPNQLALNKITEVVEDYIKWGII